MEIGYMNELEDRYTYGECRCCLERGHHREILEPYYFNGVREVYYDMFCQTFNLQLSRSTVLSTLLCARCVTRLRDARALRAQAQDSERLLAARDQQMLFVDVPTESSLLDIKQEVKEEPEEDLEEYGFIEADEIAPDLQEKSEPSGSDSDSDLVRGEAALLARFRSVPRLPTREDLPHVFRQQVEMLAQIMSLKSLSEGETYKYLGMPEALGIVDADIKQSVKERFFSRLTKVLNGLLSDVKIDSRSISVRTPSPDSALSGPNEKAAHIVNVTALLRHSNMTPFRSKNRSGFPCFYCRVTHDDFDALRKHTRLHTEDDLARVLKQTSAESVIVYADVTSLRCRCGVDVPSINELKTHIRDQHKVTLADRVTDRVVPFLMQGDRYTCPLCSCKFVTFGSVERHMNGHYRNYVCQQCGCGYVTKYRLKVHQKNLHQEGSFPCEECGKEFSSHQKHKNHVNAVHRMVKRFKCPKCPERFGEYFRRQRHLVESHGAAPLRYNCNVCDKSFDRRYTLSRHLKRDHLEERENECDICKYRCFTKNELKVHMIKHSDERIHECTVCKKAYARKKTLREHMRIHNNDRRFVCPACGQAFVQKCSLKGHLKTHHFEYTLP